MGMVGELVVSANAKLGPIVIPVGYKEQKTVIWDDDKHELFKEAA
jgi:hypothetical protein